MYPKRRNVSAYPAASIETMYQVVRDWVDRTPDAPAILRGEEDALCYADLLALIDSIGRQLNAVGIGRNDRVAIVHPDGPDMAVAILGIWSYATVVPMNPNYTAGEFAAYLRDLNVKAVAVSTGMHTPARTEAERMQLMLLELSIDQCSATIRIGGQDCAPAEPERPGPACPDDIATVLFTSGTTADAKIVPLTHRQLVGRGRLNAGFLSLTANDRALSLMPLFHGGGQSSGLASCLYAGGSVCPLPSLDANSFFRHLARLKPTYAMGAPAIFHNIRIQSGRFESVIEEAKAHIRMIRTGAGQLDHGLAHWLEAKFEAPVIQVYGSSESGWMACDPLPPARRKSGSVGLTRPGEVAVMDAKGHVASSSVAGEIVARGGVIFDGYENDAAANAAVFVDGWFRTGDGGYFDADGYLFLTGRIKEMINRGGEKVAPNEVDNALLEHPDVRSAATFPIPHPTLGEEVAAAVVLEPGADVTTTALSGFVRARLAGFKAPRRVVFVDAIPQGPTGKVQRHKLAAALGLDGAAVPPGSMYRVVRDWAERTPDAPAILRNGEGALRYRELLTAIDSIGCQLNTVGIGRNDRVAIVHPGGPDMAVAILGIWSYATVVPMNPNYTVGEFAVYLRDLGVKAVVVAGGMDTPARTAAERLHLLLLELSTDRTGVAVTIAGQSRSHLRSERTGPVGPDDVATVIVTSGTTAHSKIVPIRHRHLVRRNLFAARQLELTAEDRGLNLLRLYHSGGLNQGLCLGLVVGGSVGVPQEYSVEGFFKAVAAQRSSWCTGVYTFYHAIYGQLADYGPAIERMAGQLRFMRCGNGRLQPDIAETVEAALRVPLLSTYGTSETGAISSEPLPPALRKRDSVGTAAHENIAILDEAGRKLPVGARGEVAVSGATVFDGYENDDAANAAAFVDGWCRTGDEGYFDADGYLFLTGRIKEIINRGGEKVTPNEVDDALLAHPAVRLAVTFPMPHPTLGEEIAAAVVLEPGAAVTASALSGFVRDRLAGFKAPRRIVFVEEIPKGPTGKIQRRTLAAAFGLDGSGDSGGGDSGTGGNRVTAAAGDGASSRMPSEVEARLSALWAEALGLEHVGLDDDFFLLGGDSLQAVELFLRVEKAFGQRLPRSVLFEAGTVSEMAKRIEAAVPSPCLVPLQPDGDRPPFFCVHGGTGHVLNFRDLARHLGPEQPFYALQAAGLDGSSAPHVRIEDMAADYIREMRKVQPSGPYHLGGFSFGGRVAFVMARQLREAGEEVGLLALLDPYSRLGRLRVPLGPWLDRQWEIVRGLSPGAVPGYLLRRVRRFTARRSARARLWALGPVLRYYAGREDAMPRFLRRPDDALGLARDDYRPAPYEGSAVLFQAERNIRTHADAHAGWRKLVRGGLEVFPLSCSHSQIMEEPYVQELAREIAARLNGGKLDAANPRAAAATGPRPPDAPPSAAYERRH